MTAVGGNPEIVTAGETGWVVASDDAAALAGAIREAARDAGLRQQRAEAGRRRFHERFLFSRMLDHYRDLYREMLAQPS